MIIVPSNVGSPIPSDPNWPNVSLLVKDIGINGATNNSFYDDGPYKFLPTRNGDVTQGSFSPFGPLSGAADPTAVGGSTYFDGNSRVVTPTDNALSLGTGDWTVECWYRPAASITSLQVLFMTEPNANGVAASGNAGIGILLTSAGTVIGDFYSSSVENAITGPSGVGTTAGVWTHVAFVRSGSNLTLYLNGVSAGTTTTSQNMVDTKYVLGSYYSASNSSNFKGNISNFRVVKGAAVYTAAFKPPTAPLTAISGTSLLTCQSATAITDASSNAFTVSKYGDARAVVDSPFGYGSVYFDGSGDYVKVTPNSGLSFGTGDFTVEMWIFPSTTFSSTQIFYSYDNMYWSPAGIAIGATSSGVWWRAAIGGAWAFDRIATYSWSIGVWNHIAVTRSGSTARLFVNGQLVDSVSNSSDLGIGSNLYIGRNEQGYDYQGNISNLRVVKGSAVYTSAFTPPTAPLTAITGTSLLTCQDKGSIVDASTNSFAVSRVGDAKPVGMTPFAQKNAGYWSAYFDGSGDYITAPTSSAFTLGTGNFTIECWYYLPTSISSGNYYLFDLGSNGTRVQFYNNNIYFADYAGQCNASAGVGFTVGAWTHFAMVRSGSSYTMYINGVSAATYTGTASNPDTGCTIGSYGGNGNQFPGYISNFRIVKGTAVYTSAFTPPVAPLTAISGTSLLALQDNRLRDAGPNNFTLTKYGDVSVSRLNPFGPTLPAPTVNLASAGSVYFDGSGDYLTVPNNASLQFGSGDFTYEFWWNPSSLSVFNALASKGWTSGFLCLVNNTTMSIFMANATAAIAVDISSIIRVGAWSHIAVVRSGSSLTLYVNGAVAGTATNSSTISDATEFYIGGGSGGYTSQGYISNVRLVKGSAVYTSSFTPSTSPLTAISGTSLLTCQDAVTITDVSSNNFTVTKGGDAKAVEASPFKRVTTALAGSAYFDGSGDYLNVPSNSVFSFGTGDFTVEFWAYPTTVGASAILGINYGTGYWAFFGNYSNTNYTQTIAFFATDGVQLVSPDYSFRPNQWTHVAVTRSGTSMKLFVNGVQAASATSSVNLTNSNALYVGRDASLGRDYSGYVSNVRIVKGAAVYTANFTPPVAPVDAIGGTSLLLNFNNAGIYDSSGKVAITSGNNAKTSTAVKKYSLASTDLATSGSYLKVTDSVAYTGDWTVEFWIYPTQNIAYNTVIDFRKSGTNLYVLLNGTSITNFNLASVGGAISTNVWSHVAIVRSGGTQKMYINGTQAGAGSTDSVATYFDGTIGVDANLSSYPFLGYLEDFRITKGVARYTSTFTPPAIEAATQKG